jgi:hypothetical protein
MKMYTGVTQDEKRQITHVSLLDIMKIKMISMINRKKARDWKKIRVLFRKTLPMCPSP